jgi:opacity protein-like surface antigen
MRTVRGATMNMTTIAAVACVCGSFSAAHAGEARLDLSPPETAAAATTDPASLENAPGLDVGDALVRSQTAKWGQADTAWLTLGAGTSTDWDELSDINITAAYSYFVDRDVEFMLELAIREFDMPGEDQIGINPMLVFRRHFALDDARDWSWYIDIGIGVMLSADDIPQDGTSFNFTPRAGTGLTYQVSDDWRLIAGFRWSHISNARIFGDDDNPSSDGVMFSIGLSTSWDRLFN